MTLKRREFVKLCTGTAAGLGIAQMFHPAVAGALSGALDGSRPPVIWLQGQSCLGCSMSLLNNSHPLISDVLSRMINLEFHPALMSGEGQNALDFMFRLASDYSGAFFLVVEGSIPVECAGRYSLSGELNNSLLTTADLVGRLAPLAAAVISVGSCAAFGGIPAAKGDLTGALPAGEFLKSKGIEKPQINIPGCPPHPDWVVGALSMLLEAVATQGMKNGLAEVLKTLDDQGRPEHYYGNVLHAGCPYSGAYANGYFAESFLHKSDCRLSLGCRGPSTHADCQERKWNGGVNWCVQSAVCTGCTEPDFPDGKSPFYSELS